MSQTTDVSPSAVTAAFAQAGIEVYRVVGSEIQVAERIRLHIMDSGIRIQTAGGLSVVFRARSQRSDYPHMSSEGLLARVREAIGSRATSHGFVEQETVSREIRDPTNPEQVLDVWHEVTYVKRSDAIPMLVEDVRWALALDKYVSE